MWPARLVPSTDTFIWKRATLASALSPEKSPARRRRKSGRGTRRDHHWYGKSFTILYAGRVPEWRLCPVLQRGARIRILWRLLLAAIYPSPDFGLRGMTDLASISQP